MMPLWSLCSLEQPLAFVFQACAMQAAFHFLELAVHRIRPLSPDHTSCLPSSKPQALLPPNLLLLTFMPPSQPHLLREALSTP